MTVDADDSYDQDPEPRIEKFLDCTGKNRTFRIFAYAGGMFLDATELLEGGAFGMRMILKMDEHGHLDWGAMRERIQRRLAERDIARDPDTGKLRILRGLVRAHIHRLPEPHEEEAGPELIVDDRVVTWQELGRMLDGLEGWNLRLEILDCDAE